MQIENTAKGLSDILILLTLLWLIGLLTACQPLSDEEKNQNEYFKQTGQLEIYK